MSVLDDVAATEVDRTQDRMSHDVWLPAETVALRAEARQAVREKLAPYARVIGQREESVDSFPWEAFRGLAQAGMFTVPFDAEFGRGMPPTESCRPTLRADR